MTIEERVREAFPGRRLVEVIDSGGFGVVYRAWNEQLERAEAIKVLKSGGGVEEALREARLQARFSHDHITQIFDARQLSSGELAIAMEYVGGGTLADAIGSGE